MRFVPESSITDVRIILGTPAQKKLKGQKKNEKKNLGCSSVPADGTSPFGGMSEHPGCSG